MFKIELPMPTLSLNTLQRMHYHAVRRLRDEYCILIRLRSAASQKVKPKQFRKVWIERHGVRLLDHDNLVGGAKPLLDALRHTELIWDDSPQYCEPTYTQRLIRKGRAKTVVTVI